MRILNCSILSFWGARIKANRVCQKSQQYAPKGQKLIAQGNTLGKSIANHNAPCKGKSVYYQCFCPCRAFCYFQSVHPRRCLGLCAFGAFSPFCLTFDTPSFVYCIISLIHFSLNSASNSISINVDTLYTPSESLPLS